MSRSILCVALLVAALPAAARAADWDPSSWTKEETISIITINPEEGAHEFPVWLVVIDGQMYLRLGTKSAERFTKNTTNPFISVKIAGKDFPKIRYQNAPDMEQPVAKAMADKYWSDIFVRYSTHPMTVRLVHEN